jgi:hypothetical protein
LLLLVLWLPSLACLGEIPFFLIPSASFDTICFTKGGETSILPSRGLSGFVPPFSAYLPSLLRLRGGHLSRKKLAQKLKDERDSLAKNHTRSNSTMEDDVPMEEGKKPALKSAEAKAIKKQLKLQKKQRKLILKEKASKKKREKTPFRPWVSRCAPCISGRQLLVTTTLIMFFVHCRLISPTRVSISYRHSRHTIASFP